MDIDFARWIVVGIATVAFVVWFCGYTFVRQTVSQSVTPPDDWQQSGVDDTIPPHWIYGTAEVDSAADKISDQAVAALLRSGTEGLGAVRILEKSSDRLRFEPADAHHPQTWYQCGQIQWTAIDQKRTKVDYVLELAQHQKFIWSAWFALMLGFLALVVGAPLLYFFVASSPIPALRYQSIQMVQIVHFLWPPFVFAHVYRRGRRSLRARMDALVHNLPFAPTAG